MYDPNIICMYHFCGKIRIRVPLIAPGNFSLYSQDDPSLHVLQATSCSANVNLEVTLEGSIIYDVINIFKKPMGLLITHQVLETLLGYPSTYKYL